MMLLTFAELILTARTKIIEGSGISCILLKMLIGGIIC